MTRLPALPVPQLRTAHDVRHLTACARCQRVRDQRWMAFASGRTYYGRCIVRRFGLAALVALPAAQTDKLTLGDLGVEWMRQLLDARAPTKTRRRRI